MRERRSSFSNEMEVAKLAAPPNLEVRFVSCNESAIKRWLSSELEETVFSLTHELFMTKHHTVTLKRIQREHTLLGCLLIKILGETKHLARVISVVHYVNLSWGNVL